MTDERKTFGQWAEEYLALQAELAEAAAIKSALQNRFDHLRMVAIPDAMVEEGTNSITIKGVGRLGLTSDARVSVLAANRMPLQDWMIENDHGDLVSNTINSSTLKAWVKEMQGRGEDIPEDLIVVDPFMRASVTKT